MPSGWAMPNAVAGPVAVREAKSARDSRAFWVFTVVMYRVPVLI